MAQSVEHLTSDMISRFVGSRPASGSVLTVQSLEPVSDSVSPSLSAPPLLTLFLKNDLKKKRILRERILLTFVTDTLHDEAGAAGMRSRSCVITTAFFAVDRLSLSLTHGSSSITGMCVQERTVNAHGPAQTAVSGTHRGKCCAEGGHRPIPSQTQRQRHQQTPRLTVLPA